MKYTKEDILKMLDENPRAVERALVRIYRAQTDAEKRTKSAMTRNKVGFSSSHAPLGTYLASWVLSGKRLTGRYLDKGREIAKAYAGTQLLRVANSR